MRKYRREKKMKKLIETNGKGEKYSNSIVGG